MLFLILGDNELTFDESFNITYSGHSFEKESHLEKDKLIENNFDNIIEFPINKLGEEDIHYLCQSIQYLTSNFLLKKHYGKGIPDWTFELQCNHLKSILSNPTDAVFLVVESKEKIKENEQKEIEETLLNDLIATISENVDSTLVETNDLNISSENYNDTNNNYSSNHGVVSRCIMNSRKSDQSIGEEENEQCNNEYQNHPTEYVTLLNNILDTRQESHESGDGSTIPSLKSTGSIEGSQKVSIIKSIQELCVAGCIMVTVYPALTGVRSKLEDLVVNPKFTRRGFATKMVSAALNFCHQFGCSDVQLTSAKTRIASHQIYKKLGFQSRDAFLFAKYL